MTCGHAFASKKRKARCTAVGEPENAMKRRKPLLSEEELLVRKETKSAKRVRELAPRVLHFSAVHSFGVHAPRLPRGATCNAW